MLKLLMTLVPAKNLQGPLVFLGAKLPTLSKEEEARWGEKGAKPLIKEYAKHMKEKGLPGHEAVKFIQDYLRPYKK